MKVKDLIEKLQKFDPELPVCLADWQEEYGHPSESAAERMCLEENSLYSPSILPEGNLTFYIRGTYVCIGIDDEDVT